MRQLTQKQETFCNAIIEGMSVKDAYYHAYDTKCTDQVAYNEGSKLLKNERIQAKLNELRKPLESHARTVAISDREKKREFLWNVINNSGEDMNNRLRAVDLLNKMDSEYININKNIDEVPNQLTTLDTDTLKLLTQ